METREGATQNIIAKAGEQTATQTGKRDGRPPQPPRLPMGESFTVRRVELLRDLVKQGRNAGIVIVAAPRGFGKTALLLQYADEIRSDPGRGYAKAVDAAGMEIQELLAALDTCEAELPAKLHPLIAVDNVPGGNEEAIETLVGRLRSLRAEGYEMALSCTPGNRALLSALGDAARIGAQALRVHPREYAAWMRTFSIAGDLDVYGLTQGIPALVASLSSAVWQAGTEPAVLDSYAETLYRDAWQELVTVAPDTLRGAGMMLLMGSGKLAEMEMCGVTLSREVQVRLTHDYPLFGLDAAARTFSCVGSSYEALAAVRKMVAEAIPGLPARAVRALMKAGRVDRAVALAQEELGRTETLEIMGQFPVAFTMAGQGRYIARLGSSLELEEPDAEPTIGVVLARYTASLTLGDFKTARRMAMCLSISADEIERDISPDDWAVASALRGVWASCTGIGLPDISYRNEVRHPSETAQCLRDFVRLMRAMFEGKPMPGRIDGAAISRTQGEGGEVEDVAVALPNIFARMTELMAEVLSGSFAGVDERDDRLAACLEVLRERNLVPVVVLVRLVLAVRRIYAGMPLSDERAFVDAGTLAVRTSDQALQLFCLVFEGWQFLGLDQMINAGFRAQQVLKLADKRLRFVLEQATLLERTTHLCNTSRAALCEEAELLDLSHTPCSPARAWAEALSLAVVRFDAELSAWFSLHRTELLDPTIRLAARLSLRALGKQASSLVRLLPEQVQGRYLFSDGASRDGERLFEVVGDAEKTVLGQVTIRLFGGLKIERNGHVLTSALWRRRKTSVVAARLAIAPGAFVKRSALQEEFWPTYDYDHARNSLYSTLSVLRRALGQKKSGPQYLIVQGEGVAFNAEYVVSDAMRFDLIAREVLLKRRGITAPNIIDACLKLEQLYAGPLYVPDAAGSDYFMQMREAFRAKFVDCMLRGAETAIGEEDLSTAGWMVEAALAETPMREDVIRMAMRVYELGGRRREVVELYRAHLERLKRQERAIPEPKTRALYDQIVSGRGVGRIGRG